MIETKPDLNMGVWRKAGSADVSSAFGD